jgi:hypothetical protein
VNPLPFLSPEFFFAYHEYIYIYIYICVCVCVCVCDLQRLIEIQTCNFLHLLRQEIKVPLLRPMSTLSQTLVTTDALVWMTTRISLPQSTRNLGEIVVVAAAANTSRRFGKALSPSVLCWKSENQLSNFKRYYTIVTSGATAGLERRTLFYGFSNLSHLMVGILYFETLY